MSSRVQKGSQVFKPVVKSRGRTNEAVSRNSSVVPEIARTPGPPQQRAPSVINESALKSSGLPQAPEETASKDDSRQATITQSVTKPNQQPSQAGLTPQTPPGALKQPPTLRSSASSGNASATKILVPSRSQARTIARTDTPLNTSHPSQLSQSITDQENLNSSSNVSQATGPQESTPTMDMEPGPSRINASSTEAQNGSPSKRRDRIKRAESQPVATEVAGDGEQEGLKSRMSRPRRKATNRRASTTANRQEDDKTEDEHYESSGHTQQLYADGGNNSGSESEGRRKKRRRSTTASSTSTRRRRTRTSSVPVFDNDADPGQDLDPTTVTMADICQDTGQGRVSSKAAIIQRNHLAWKASNREKRERMRVIMEAKKHGRQESDTEDAQPTITTETEAPPDSGTPAPADVAEVVEESNGDEFNYRQNLETNRFSVKVRIGPNGETIIDEESLHIDRAENDGNTEHYQHVEESDQTKFTNSATYTKKLRGSRWSPEETELFFQALSQFGENYELISYILPGRDRKACKNKFKTEDKKNSSRITYCLTHKIPYDMQTLSRLTGKDFSGPTPEIRAPEVATLAEPVPSSQPESGTDRPASGALHAKIVRKKSRTPSTAGDAVEILGNIDDFES